MNNKGADQPAHLRRLISAFVIPLLESNIISKLDSSEIPISSLVSEAEENGLSLALTNTLKTGFVAMGPILSCKVSVANCVDQDQTVLLFLLISVVKNILV